MSETSSDKLNAPPVVGVVVPAFNAAWSIGDTLRSIRAQRLAEFRCIIVDDGSTEDMGPTIAGATACDDRFTVVTQQNLGLAAARNRGLHEVSAPFTAFIDSDDLWHPDFLLQVVAKLRSAPAAPFAYAHSLRIDRANHLIAAARWPHEPRHDLEGLLCLNSVSSGSAAVHRTASLRAAGGFDPAFRSRGAEGAEDWHLLLRLASVAPPVLVPQYLGVYRLNEQGMSQGNPARQRRAVRAVMEDARRRYPQLRDQHFRDARTALNGWLMPSVLRNQGWRSAAGLFVQSYLLNPLWFLNRDLRTLHAMKLRSVIASRQPRQSLCDITDPDGTRPFAFLNEPMAVSTKASDVAAASVPLSVRGR